MRNKKVLRLTEAAMIAALYVVLTYLMNLLGLANGAIQLRLSETLTVLPYFTTAAIPGVTVGCLLSNILTGAALPDIIFGTFASLMGAIGSYIVRKHKYLVSLPPIIANTLIIPVVLKISYGLPDGLLYLMFTVGVGEIISCGILGTVLLVALTKYSHMIFDQQ